MSQPSTSETCLLNADDEILFRYSWPLKIKKRLMANGEQSVLNVSPSFCTAYNGVQFTWLIRICDEYVLDMDEDEDSLEDRRLVNITLYYKNGPASEIQLSSAKFSVDAEGRRQFSNIPLESLDYIKGSGWPHSSNSLERIRLSSFIQENIGKNISVILEMKVKMRWFLPLGYLPEIDSRDNELQVECERVLEEMLNGKLNIPDIDLFDITTDRYAFHRNCFSFGCKEVERRCQNLSADESKIENLFASHYFHKVINQQAECFEDFVDLLAQTFVVHFPALKMECERYICHELMLETADDIFVKKMLLLAERFNLKVLKMVCFGVIVDRYIIGHTKRGSVDEIREELLQIAEQIKTNDDEDLEQHKENCDVVVGSVIDQLEELAKHIRKVSMSPDSGCPGSGIAPVCSSPSPQQLISQQGRRSSLKTSRELLSFSSSSALGPSGSSPRMESRRRRSVMFSLPSTLDEDPMGKLKNESRTETSSTSSNSLSSRVLPDVDEHSSLDADSTIGKDEYDEVDGKSSFFSFDEPYMRCERA